MTIEVLALVVGALVVACVGYTVATYNAAQRWAQIIPELAANITVLLRKRQDLIGRLVEVVRSYDLHEAGVATGVAEQFGAAGQAGQSTSAVARLASLRMAFPELRADALYTTLMEQLAPVETEISQRRERYNSAVRSFNTLLVQFPSNLALGRFSFRPATFIGDLEPMPDAPPKAT